ncbi:MAG: bifunctional phosphoribosyl-AMP cyclohydrolase/phosphoribosyl-ATP diphosphatase HisIE [Solirubrobacterales bacterium]|nr:bifunctional phosphoribosyl-AMP cyclohydrolase/phosphoribosyl-ATP diphosphatase HisIE [Solirubrobacterales bacterium]MCB8915612.1 bifunctional phosphoribosyl-AMP cyclohydrolase/phosphoribosyl-ATP diphosphatase HisIE [Thermoleophilales bacterium]
MASVQVAFDRDGLVPCIAQDARTGEVLTLAYMNEESLRLTEETGLVTYFSRSRQKIWQKGEESGNVQRVRQLRVDCDGDAILALVEPAGPACHTGERTCFFRDLESGETPAPVNGEAVAALARTIDSRLVEKPEGSYVVKLLEDPEFAGEKVMEEAEEVSRAVREESDERVANEAADVLFHLVALIRSRGITLEDVGEVLNGRRA